jgi:hypothetical protein
LVVSLAVEIVFDARLADESATTELKAALRQKALSWRRLTGPQQREIAKALSAFAKEEINVLVYERDLEAWAFADAVEVALGSYPQGAPWNAHFGQIVTSPRLTSGIIVEVVATANRHDRDAAKALADVLRSNEF